MFMITLEDYKKFFELAYPKNVIIIVTHESLCFIDGNCMYECPLTTDDEYNQYIKPKLDNVFWAYGKIDIIRSDQ